MENPKIPATQPALEAVKNNIIKNHRNMPPQYTFVFNSFDLLRRRKTSGQAMFRKPAKVFGCPKKVPEILSTYGGLINTSLFNCAHCIYQVIISPEFRRQATIAKTIKEFSNISTNDQFLVMSTNEEKNKKNNMMTLNQ